MARLIASVVAAVPVCGTAAAQDFRSGLSAYNSGDYVRAFHDWLGLAEQGDPAAEAGIGFLFHKGLGVAQDDAEAATWFVKAAEQASKPPRHISLTRTPLRGPPLVPRDALLLRRADATLLRR